MEEIISENMPKFCTGNVINMWRCHQCVPIDSVSPSAHGFEYSAAIGIILPLFAVNWLCAINSSNIHLKCRRHKTFKFYSSNRIFISFRLNFGYKNVAFSTRNKYL